MTIADRLTDINNTKLAIKASIEAKGQTVGSIPFSEYPSKIDAITGGGSSPVINEWVRPSDWLPITKPDGTSQKVIGLFAVFDSESNYVAFSASGAYTVDWGDGSAPENYTSGTKCQHKYTFASIDPATTTAEGYRQVIITITPQAGQNLSVINCQQYHSEVGGNYGYTAWLELYASTSHADVLGGLSNWMVTTNQTMLPMLKAVYLLPCNTVVSNNIGSTWFKGQAENVEYVEISRPNVVITGSGPFQYLRLIKKFNILPGTKVTTGKDLFLECNSLVEAPMLDLSNCLSTSYMFSNCTSLQIVPQYVTTNVTDMSYMFNLCRSLETVPLFNTQNNTTMRSMFSNCYVLKSVPLFNTAKVNSFLSTFSSCTLLTEVPLFNTSKVTSFSSAFSNCFLLKTVPAFDTSLCTDFSYMFSACYSLVEVPTFNTASATTMAYMFNGAYSLKKIPDFNTTNNTSISNFTGNSRSQLIEIPVFDMRKSSGLQNLSSSSIWRFKAYGFISPLSVSNNMLSKRELNEIIENLGNPTASQSLTISNNPGATSNPTYSRSSTTTAVSAVVLVSDTSNFIVGETQVIGTGITNSRTVTLTDAGDLVTLAGHGLPNGKRVSFTSITSTTGISVYRPYYVVNATTDTFQLSLTADGAPIALTTDGSGAIIYQTLVIAIDPNVSVTVDVPASVSGTSNLAYRNLNTQIAVMKRWTVTG